MNQVNSIYITHGTHGDERTGIEFARKVLNRQISLNYPGLDIKLLCVNPQASLKNLRFIDEDIQNLFDFTHIYDKSTPMSYELKRAREVTAMIGGMETVEANDKNPDLILDLHNTTTKMGITVNVFDITEYTSSLCAHLHYTFPELIKLWYTPGLRPMDPTIQSIAHHGICIECEVAEHGKTDPKTEANEQKVIHEILQWTSEVYNKGLKQEPRPCPVYVWCGEIPYNGNWKAYRGLIGKDYQLLNAGDPYLEDSNGNVLNWEGPSVYPIFIGEPDYANASDNTVMDLTMLNEMML